MASSTMGGILLAFSALPAVAAAQQAPAPQASPPEGGKAAAKPKETTVEGVVITGAAPDAQSTIDRRSYTFGKDLQATTGTIGDALRNVPSVEVDLQGNLSMRGDSNVTVLVDGKPSPTFQGVGRADALQQLPADQYERVEVITNPSAALNPEGSGGVINLITKKSRGAGTTGSVYVTGGSGGLKRAGVNFGYNSKKLAVTGSVSGNYQRNKNESQDDRSALDPVTGRFADSQFNIVGRNLNRTLSSRINASYQVDPKTQLTASANYNQFLLYGHPFNHFQGEDPDGNVVSILNRQGQRRVLNIDTSYNAGLKHSFAGDGHELSLDLLRNQSRPRDDQHWMVAQQIPVSTAPFEGIQDDATQTHEEARLNYSRPMGTDAKLKVGYELKHDDQLFDYRAAVGDDLEALVPVPARSNLFDFKQTINTGFATYERAFGDLSAQIGLRLENVSWDLDQRTTGQLVSQEYFRVYPSLHLNWKLDDDHKLSASYSHRVQRPPPVLLNPRAYLIDPKNIQQGNPDLDPSDTQSFEVGYETKKGQGYYLATVYYRSTKDDFTNVLRSAGNGVFISTFDNLGSNRSVGLEVVANNRLTKTLTYNASANLYWSQIDSGDIVGGLGKQSAVGIGGRANLNWQVRPDDLVQVNAFVQGKRLQAQGFIEPMFTLNLGWRHKIDDRVTLTATAQDVFGTTKFERKFETPTLREHLVNKPLVQALIIRLDYRFGGGKAKGPGPGFEYDTGGGQNAAPAGPG